MIPFPKRSPPLKYIGILPGSTHLQTPSKMLSETTKPTQSTSESDGDKRKPFDRQVKEMVNAITSRVGDLQKTSDVDEHGVRIITLAGTNIGATMRSELDEKGIPTQGEGDGDDQLGGTKSLKKVYDALLLDAGGTLLQLPHPVEETYASIGKKYGLGISSAEIKNGFKRAFSATWPQKLRYQGDARPFWKFVVSEATGCGNDDYFEELYEYFANGDAWRLPDEAFETLFILKDAGVKLAVVSNFDTRLRKLLKDLNVIDLFDALIISSEVGYEKPDPNIFKAALDHLNVEASKAVHIGDDLKADKDGANAVGVDCWLWGGDIKTFRDVQNRILVEE